MAERPVWGADEDEWTRKDDAARWNSFRVFVSDAAPPDTVIVYSPPNDPDDEHIPLERRVAVIKFDPDPPEREVDA